MVYFEIVLPIMKKDINKVVGNKSLMQERNRLRKIAQMPQHPTKTKLF
jgi:hypothetical protein